MNNHKSSPQYNRVKYKVGSSCNFICLQDIYFILVLFLFLFLILRGLFADYLDEGNSDCRFTLSSAEIIYIGTM